jgi:hypothetical protein
VGLPYRNIEYWRRVQEDHIPKGCEPRSSYPAKRNSGKWEICHFRMRDGEAANSSEILQIRTSQWDSLQYKFFYNPGQVRIPIYSLFSQFMHSSVDFL